MFKFHRYNNDGYNIMLECIMFSIPYSLDICTAYTAHYIQEGRRAYKQII